MDRIDGLPVTLTMWRGDGRWHLEIYGPLWALEEFRQEMEGKGLFISGGGYSDLDPAHRTLRLAQRRAEVINADDAT